MGLYYLDTSALVKLYVREPGTEEMLRLANATPSHTFTVLSLAPVEFHAAIRRRERAGDVGADAADGILLAFAKHLAEVFIRQPITEATVETALQLIDRYTLRAYDAMQLAGCLVMPRSAGGEPVRFACADISLEGAARSEGLATLNPGRSEEPV
ncbi:MAG TPA: type II toxin-antitoxin system VapC family toxin [Candidatus Baltobacteraceae bacterium]|nr:type II toxin-antitoxin system VapC family toxin [Candidatus Baltobacteraceae bacterium]